MSKQNAVESKVREIRRKTRRRYSAEEKIRIVLEGLRGKADATVCTRWKPAHTDECGNKCVQFSLKA